jgi:ssDNA-binding Zn-finger/Zn-ribbon topoisomerase 1
VHPKFYLAKGWGKIRVSCKGVVAKKEEQVKSVAENKEEFMAEAGAMYDELTAWRAAHPAASFDEMAGQVTVQRQALMGEMLKVLAKQAGRGEFLAERTCPGCGGAVHYKGEKRRTVLHAEGQAVLERGYHHCDQCGHGFFPSGRGVSVGCAGVDAGDGGPGRAARRGDSVVSTGGGHLP